MNGKSVQLPLFGPPPPPAPATAPAAIDPRRRRLFVPTASDSAPIERTDWALAHGPVGSFAWAKARMEAISPLGEEMDAAQRQEFAQRVAADARKPKQQLTRADHLATDNGVELGMDEDGNVYRLDESVHCTPIDEAPDIARIHAANEVFNLVCERETGLLVDPKRKAKGDKDEAQLLAQTHRIAKKLEQAGAAAYLESEWTIATYGVHSGELKTLPKFRRKTFLPFVAAKLREPRVRDLEYWLQSDPWARFWTLTMGSRVRLSGLRRAIKRLHARIRRLNDAEFMKAAGVRIVFRSTELGSIEKKRAVVETEDGPRMALLDDSGLDSGSIERDTNGELWFHPHAHCLVHLEKGRLEYGAWCRFLEQLRAHWGDWMDDGGVIKSAREAVKYITKPGEVEHLTPEELVALDAQLARLHMVQPLGALAEQIAARDEKGLTLWPETTQEGRIWVEDLDPNRRAKASKEKQRIRYAERDAQGRAPFSGQMTETEFAKEAARQHAPDVDGCAVVARVSPGAASNCVKEPRVVVMFKRWDARRVEMHPLVERLREHTREAWLAGCALAAATPAPEADSIRVHTGTSTVRDGEEGPPPPKPKRVTAWFRRHVAGLERAAAEVHAT